jgi:NTP pyrophosphatase (non-canonical NTP hydrolase)
MNWTEYVNETERTAGAFNDETDELLAWTVGLTGEAGELLNAVKKIVWHGHRTDPEALGLELGDVLFYYARILNNLGLTLEEVMDANIAKLRARYPDGFDPERSRNRDA